MKNTKKKQEERRVYHRFDSDVNIMTADQGDLSFAFIRDLSHGGAFIETKKMVAVGDKFEFTLKTGRHKAKVASRVIRHKFCKEKLRPLGFAVAFEEAKGESRFVRDDLLLYAMTKKYLDVWDEPYVPAQHS